MIVPDINLLVYAYNDGSPWYAAARGWWEGLINGSQRIGVPWVVSTGFIRLMTHSRALMSPVSAAEAIGHVSEWFLYPTSRRSIPAPTT